MPTTVAVRVIALCVLVLMTSVLDAQAQSPVFAGAAPLAGLVHKRWENEAADGTAAAATTVALGAAVDAFIGLASCG